MSTVLNPPIYVRTRVFGCKTQDDFAVLLETTQASVCRWEAQGRFPGHAQRKIRELAHQRDIKWQDSWFFEVPAEALAAAGADAA